MRIQTGLLVALGLSACAKDDPAPSAHFDSPWEHVAASEQTASGAFHGEIDASLPGAGWFRAASSEGEDASRVRLVEVKGATWPVVHVELFGWADTGWDVLTLDISYASWAAGDVPVDGESAVGRLTTVDGEVRYLLGGALHVTAPGLQPGETAAAWFTDVTLSEVAP